MVIKELHFRNIFSDSKFLYTKNLVPGYRVYNEKLVVYNNVEYRRWSPRRSKLAAMLIKKCSTMPIVPGAKVLYLGAASGTTCSHISDIIENGVVYCLEYSPRAFRDLVQVCRRRNNMIPILGNANKASAYEHFLEYVDVIYQDIAQRNQAEIFLRNVRFLKKGCFGIIMLKARSISAVDKPDKIYKQEIVKLKEGGKLTIAETINLEPYEREHLAIVSIKI
ncbi:MAG: fibrillarin-like rRNA/tRNA 2'-O-methyltransferase [Candidatus Thermoplasmatota archaeon]|nr:fibrillarin-like rRNA/tRNA 2'-O-methyltransferase [Candidatus Thermoplasmatota archaeon]MDI6856076.1 fibrillarin-like rRNA/tRNA 2'-O-methyltransferase [Candidatus Thermoplasmatota archaeon]